MSAKKPPVLAASAVGGKFDSIGNAMDQKANAALMVRLVGEIGPDGYLLLDDKDRSFVTDTKAKLQQRGNQMFGWRQVEAMVRVHADVTALRSAMSSKEPEK